ncbi:MAG: winged helix-turn-helix domain-containing protein [Clostridia bacterium]|nr:winged helix-turn-helix domain-containing protein [Clostridia bacterium]
MTKAEPLLFANAVRTAGPFGYNTSTLRFYKNGVEIPLSAKENALVKLLFDHRGQVFSKADLYTLIWGNDMIDENAIMVYVNRIRRKIEDDPAHPVYLRTVRGAGYRFVI